MNTYVKTGLYIISLAILAACQTKENSNLINLGPKEFSEQLSLKKSTALLVDVRTPEEFKSGHLPGAILIDYNGPEFAEKLEKLPKDKEVYVYCRSGRRSASSVSQFIKAGYKTVTNLEQGIISWQAAGLPVTVE